MGTGLSYVWRGVAMICKSPDLWKMVAKPFFMSVCVFFAVLVLMMTIAWFPQANLFENAGMASGWAIFLAFFLTLVEVALITIVVFSIMYGQLQQNVFNEVYKKEATARGNIDLAALDDANCCVGLKSCCGKLVAFRIILSMSTILLNSFPVLGSMVYAFLNGFFYAWDLHSDYLDKQGIVGFRNQLAVIRKDPWYHAFGMVALFMETVPFVNILFMMTNAAGAALYAADKEPAQTERADRYRSRNVPRTASRQMRDAEAQSREQVRANYEAESLPRGSSNTHIPDGSNTVTKA